jgi:hypothetical protein
MDQLQKSSGYRKILPQNLPDARNACRNEWTPLRRVKAHCLEGAVTKGL